MKPIYCESYLTNPEIFQINRLEAHSDHKYFNKREDINREMDMRYSLNGSWKISWAKNRELRVRDFYKVDYSSVGWDTIKVPSHVELEGFGKPHYVNTMYPWDGHEAIVPPAIPKEFNPVSSYIKTFEVPKEWDRERVYIHFGGVESAFYLWVNGEFVGYSEDSFTPAEFDISPFLVEGENKIALEVYKWSTGSWLEDQDFWRFSGIFRDVYLFTKPTIHIEDFFVTTDLTDNYTVATINNRVKLLSDSKRDITITQELFYNGTLVSKSDAQYSCESTNQLEIQVSIDNPALWSAEKPNLYKMILTIKDSNGEELEVVPYTLGIREFKITDGVMCINGKRVVFKGVNRHEFSCFNGRVVSLDEMLWDIKFLKSNNFNSVRTSHYPNNSIWYELCDEYGLYVIDEANIESHGTWQKMGACKPDFVVPDGKPEWLGSVLDRGISMVERDKNHPSIIIWSCGNEAYGGENLFKLSQYFRERDPRRVVHYESIFWDRRYNDTSDMESRMYAKVHEIEDYLNSEPKKPFILCEYSHAMGNSNGGLHKYTELEKKYPLYQGGFIWDYIDQSIMKLDQKGEKYLAFGGDYSDRPTDYNFCVNGLVYGDRVPSPKMQEVKALFTDFKIKCGRESVTIDNTSLFTNLNEYTQWLVLYRDGVEIERRECSYSLEPLSEATFTFDAFDLSKSGEYIVQFSLHLKEETKFALHGHLISSGQFIEKVDSSKDEMVSKESSSSKKSFRVENCDVNLGIKGDNFHHIFSKGYSSIISMKFQGVEYISAPIQPNFWRAPTDNDRGNRMSFRYAQWKIASLYPRCISHEVEIEEDFASIKYLYELPTTPTTTCSLKYSVNYLGEIEVTEEYPGYEGISFMPAFGITFKVPKRFENIVWYGNGPIESYIDREHGARIGIYRSSVKESLSKYVIPQECGNHTKVRWFDVVDGSGEGISIIGERPFEFSALPCSNHELESSYHHSDLPPHNYTVLNINKIQMGVGGDDSWGAMTHDEYLVDSSKAMVFKVTIRKK